MLACLVYAITQFVAQMLMTALGICPVLSYLTNKHEFISVAMAYFAYVVDVLSLTGPVCLFIHSSSSSLNGYNGIRYVLAIKSERASLDFTHAEVPLILQHE